ncbi:MAG: phosphate ABC transporter substrate-binding protein PstS [Ignavibacteriales bacterium]|nr:phosphate ABC transporter substrate-binding protein PstS [Ignavibacteriales bacterium]MBI3788530.1 phosphate ABC transporter substrate-binding protein PstS [Ignavibacteriales bacterium]
MKTIKMTLLIMFTLILGGGALQAQLKLNGAGATFPYVIYSKWFDVYHTKTSIEFNYQSIGSGGGIKQIIEGTVDFGATDGPMTPEQMNDAKTKQATDIFHIPTVLGAVVVTYNLPDAGKDLKLTPEVLASIFLGEITKWNDAKITALNSGVKLPDQQIIVAHRSDGSGTSFIFTDYLTKVSKTWEAKVGRGTSVNWPAGLGGKGNEGVSGLVKQTPGAIGYVELAYAVKNNLPYASLKNKSGKFVSPTLESVTAAAAGASKNMPDDLRVSITDADGKDSYPISGFTWLLVYTNMKDKQKGEALVKFLKWAMTDGQSYAKDLLYAPLPKDVIKRCESKIAQIKY